MKISSEQAVAIAAKMSKFRAAVSELGILPPEVVDVALRAYLPLVNAANENDRAFHAIARAAGESLADLAEAVEPAHPEAFARQFVEAMAASLSWRFAAK